MDARAALRLEEHGEEWVLVGGSAAWFGLVDEYLSHLLDRNYSRATVRAYGYDLLAFCRWLIEQDLELEAVTTNVLLLIDVDNCLEAGADWVFLEGAELFPDGQVRSGLIRRLTTTFRATS